MIVENTMSMSLSLSKEDFLFNSLMKYYNKVENMQLVSEILKNNTMISLRLIDWFVTKHSKSNGIQYETEGKIFSVYSNYKTQLKAFSKKVFDPFCRSTRFTLKKHGIVVVTTVGQLNFFRWAIENKVLKYIFENVQTLEINMKAYNKAEQTLKEERASHKRAVKSQITPISSESLIDKSFIRKLQISSIVSFD